MTITVQLSAVSGQDVTVPFTVNASSTATDPADYTITGSPVTITAGSTTQTINITVSDDALNETNETVIVDMGAPTNANQGGTTFHKAIVKDNSATPSVSCTAATQNADEASNMTITVQLSAVSGRDVTVPFTVNATSTAADPADYSITGSPVTITAGSTTQTITITVSDDTLDEDNETVVVDMGAPTNANQ